MSGWILLEGGAEFAGLMSEPDKKALSLAGGVSAPVRIIPTAAAPDNNARRAGENGIRWFSSLGALDVKCAWVTDKPSANDPLIARDIANAKLIYLLGGFPHYLAKTLIGSQSLKAIRDAISNGAVVAGSSAGAMVLCQYYLDPDNDGIHTGLNMVKNALVIPHFNTFGKGWAKRLVEKVPGTILLGIDERTGIISDANAVKWSVLGAGGANIIREGEKHVYPRGTEFLL